MVFRLFCGTGTAFAVVQQFAKALAFSQAIVRWGVKWQADMVYMTQSRVLNILKNPCYAGRYVFGRYHYRRQINSSGEVSKQVHPVSMSEWRVSLQEHHEGYINWDEYLKNQERLEKNRTNGGEMMLSGRARARRNPGSHRCIQNHSRIETCRLSNQALSRTVER